MSESELIEIARSCADHIATLFGQLITITFAMIVAIYYFLNRSALAMKVFAFIVYMIGMLMYFGLMLAESSIRIGAVEALRALTPETLSRPAAHLLEFRASWVSTTTSLLSNLAFHVLWIGVFYLLFFWKKADAAHPKA